MVRDPVGFSRIRRRILVGFYAHGFVIGANLVSSGFVGPESDFVKPRLDTRGNQAEIEITS
jgi:hypothetical protein